MSWRSLRPKLYEAQVHLLIEKSSDLDPVRPMGPEFRYSGHNEWLRAAGELSSRPLLSEVAMALHLSSRWPHHKDEDLLDTLESRTVVEIDETNRSLILKARDLTPKDAATLANAIADHFITYKETSARTEALTRVKLLEQEIEERHREANLIETQLVAEATKGDGNHLQVSELRRRLSSVQNLLHSLNAKYQLAELESRENARLIRLSEVATPHRTKKVLPLWLSLPFLIPFSLVGGFALVLIPALLFRKTRFEQIATLISQLQLKYAGMVPLTGRSPIVLENTSSSWLEPYRDLRNRLLRPSPDGCLFLTVMPQRDQPRPAEVIVSLACVLADAAQSVLVIDADFRNPQLHPFFDAAHHPGLSDFLSGEMRLEETVIRARRPNLWFMPSGPLHHDPSRFLNGRRMDDLVWEMRRRFDFVLIASPSIHEASDAGLLASIADFTVLVAPFAGYSLRRLRETSIALSLIDIPLTSVLLTYEIALDSTETASPLSSNPPYAPDREIRQSDAAGRGK